MPYTGPYGVSCFSNASSADITTNFNNHPWCTVFRSWNQWNNFELSYGNFTWGGLTTSLRLAIDNNFKLIIALSMGDDAPSWVYSANTGGKVDKITLHDSGGASYDCTYPMDPDLRNHWIRILDALDTLLDTAYGGKTYRDAVAFVTTGAGQTQGTEMTIGDAGDSFNTSAWAAFDTTYGYANVAARRAAYEAAWEADIQASLAHLTSVPISIATAASTWGDSRNSTDRVVNWCDANITAQADRDRLLFGPTDMRVDRPNAVSYKAWSAAADANLLNIRAKGFTCWAQSAGWTNWWSGTFTGGTLNAMETAYLTDALLAYNVVIMEIQPDIYGHVAGLETWAQNTLQPAIIATAPNGNGGGGVATVIDADWSGLTIPVPTAHTIVQGPSLACSSVVIIADPGNTDVVCFGGPDVHAETAKNKGFKLQPGQTSPRISITNLNVLFFDANHSGDKFLIAVIN